MAQTAKETAEVLLKKFGKEQALEKAEGGIKAAQDVLDSVRYEDSLFTFQAKYWEEVVEELNSK
jgi:hypothetical protein